MTYRSTQIETWFKTALGQRLLLAEIAALQPVLSTLFGYHLLQIGTIGQGRLLENSRIGHRFLLTDDLTEKLTISTVYAHADALPFAAESIDVVLLPHVLEFQDNPHLILREIDRVLLPEGYLILLGFNPISLWGLCKWLFAWRDIAPWNGHFLTALRVKDWLTLLGFDIVEQSTFFFAPPFQRHYFTAHTVHLLELLGASIGWHCGAVYLLIAKKRRFTLTPLSLQWSTTESLLSHHIVATHFKKS